MKKSVLPRDMPATLLEKELRKAFDAHFPIGHADSKVKLLKACVLAFKRQRDADIALLRNTLNQVEKDALAKAEAEAKKGE